MYILLQKSNILSCSHKKLFINQAEINFKTTSPIIKEISDVTAYSKYFFGVVFTSFFKYSLTVFFSNLGIKIVAITVKINANIKLHIITEVTEIAQSSSTTPIVIPFSVKPERRWSIIAKTTFAIIQTAKAVKDKVNRVGSAINIASTIYSIQSSIKNDIFSNVFIKITYLHLRHIQKISSNARDLGFVLPFQFALNLFRALPCFVHINTSCKSHILSEPN